MGKTEGVRLNLTKPQPLTRSIYWAEQFLNKLGGDFTLAEMTDETAMLTNISSCAGMCGNTNMCDSLERAINVAIKVFDVDLMADLTDCGQDGSGSCRLEVYFK